jgi:hypothetical protein
MYIADISWTLNNSNEWLKKWILVEFEGEDGKMNLKSMRK